LPRHSISILPAAEAFRDLLVQGCSIDEALDLLVEVESDRT